MRWGPMLLALFLAGCTRSAAPAIPFLGAYFPSWLLSAFAGIFAAIVLRVMFVKTGLDEVLPARLVVYIAAAVVVGLLVSSMAFGR